MVLLLSNKRRYRDINEFICYIYMYIYKYIYVYMYIYMLYIYLPVLQARFWTNPDDPHDMPVKSTSCRLSIQRREFILRNILHRYTLLDEDNFPEETSTSSWWVLDIWLFTSSFGGRGIRNWEGRAGSLAGGSRTPLPAPAILAGAMHRAGRRCCLVQTLLCALARRMH